MRRKSWKVVGLVAVAGIVLAGCLAPGTHLVTPKLKNNTAVTGLWHSFGGNGCYWARLDGNGTVLASATSPSGPRYVEIKAGDTWFRTSNCVLWVQADGPFDRRVGVNANGTFGNGDFRIGKDIPSGTYIASSPVGCYWARLSGFSGQQSDIIESNVGSGEVEIAPGDKGFTSTNCGTWSRTSAKVSQTITFGTIANRTMAQSPFTVSATASSGLTVTFSTTTPLVCTSSGTNGSSITLIATGACTVRASQSGNATYNPANTVDRTFTVS